MNFIMAVTLGFIIAGLILIWWENRKTLKEEMTMEHDFCPVCGEELKPILDEVSTQADHLGMESLTEYQQMFLSERRACPDCIEMAEAEFYYREPLT